MLDNKLADAISKQWGNPAFEDLVKAFERFSAEQRQGLDPDPVKLQQFSKAMGLMIGDPNVSIKSLGTGNTAVFKITSTSKDKLSGKEKEANVLFRRTQLTEVNTEAYNKCASAQLEKKSSKFVTPSIFLKKEELSHEENPKERLSNYFVMSEFLPKGSLQSVTKNESVMLSDQQRYERARDRIDNTIDMLVGMLNNQVVFIDLKPTNLLIDQNGKLRISDEKSFFDTQSAGVHKVGDRFCVDCGKVMVASTAYIPDDFKASNRDFDIQKGYCFTLGKILYELSTGDFECKVEDVNRNDPFFKTELGKVAGDMIDGKTINLIDAKDALEAISKSKLTCDSEGKKIDLKSEKPRQVESLKAPEPTQTRRRTLTASSNAAVSKRTLKELSGEVSKQPKPIEPHTENRTKDPRLSLSISGRNLLSVIHKPDPEADVTSSPGMTRK
ncbi:MAG: hypothetical protein AB7F64_00315 [Gammaproteobacteria bacterium]